MDDERMSIVVFWGRKVMKNFEDLSKLRFKSEGDPLNVISYCNIECDNILNGAQADGNINCGGEISGGVCCGTLNASADILGGVVCSGNISCLKITGDVSCEGDIILSK